MNGFGGKKNSLLRKFSPDTRIIQIVAPDAMVIQCGWLLVSVITMVPIWHYKTPSYKLSIYKSRLSALFFEGIWI